MTASVFINGYGTIGKRIVDAIIRQNDMKVIGIGKRTPDFKAYLAMKRGLNIYVPSEEHARRFEEFGINISGLIEDALKEADIIVDASPGGFGENNKSLYEKYNKPAIFQGGEKSHVAEVSFVAQVNYTKALGKRFIRVVSCNTTGMSRILHTISTITQIRRVRGTLIRRAADPWEVKKGPINAIVPSFKLPSHHSPDVQTVLGNMDIFTAAVVVPTTIMHLHVLNIEVDTKVSKTDVIDSLENAPRIIIVNTDLKLDSTAAIMELARDLLRVRNDLYEVAVFDQGISVNGRELWLIYAVHQEAIVVPENVDAIRASLKLIENPEESIKKTDSSLGIISKL